MKYLLISYKKHLNDKKIKKNELTASKSRLFFANVPALQEYDRSKIVWYS